MRSTWLELNTRKRIAVVFLVVCLISLLFFIFYNSSRDAVQSSDQSGFFVRFVVEKILRLDYESQSAEFLGEITHFVRKAAHFTEYAVLSAILFLILHIFRASNARCFCISSLFAFGTGLLDEFTQLFSEGRACRFGDAVIDMSGGIFACCVIILLLKIRARRTTK